MCGPSCRNEILLEATFDITSWLPASTAIRAVRESIGPWSGSTGQEVQCSRKNIQKEHESLLSLILTKRVSFPSAKLA